MNQNSSLALPACADCGMTVTPNEYHPFAACVIYKFTKCSKTTRENINAVREYQTQLIQSQPEMTGRTPKDYAIEHAEYMAVAAEHYLNVMNEALTEDTDLRGNQESISDAFSNLRSMIFEFRKRAARS